MAQQNLDGREYVNFRLQHGENMVPIPLHALLFHRVIPVYTPHIGDHAPNLRETDHLLSKVKHDRKISLCLSDLHHAFWVAILVACIVGTVIGSLATMNGLNSLTDTNLRKYELDKRKIESERKQWALEREDHNRTARREHEERERRIEFERQQWALEREDYNRIARREREELERRIEFERQQWALEREDHDRAARREHEELERKRSLIAWGDLQPSPVCTKYQTKEYTATLYNVPFGVDPIEECYKRTIEINGHQEKPILCEDRVSTPAYLFHSRGSNRQLILQGMCGRTTGHFVTDNEPSCRPHWAEINYKVASSPYHAI